MDDDAGHINVTNNILSQSYCEGIKRITGVTNGCILNFEIPKKILVHRQKSWKTFFDKYSQEFSDDLEINIDTLEPEVNLNDVLLEPCLPVRKTRQIQYWINTGESPYIHFWPGQSDTSFSSQNKKSSSSRCSSLSRSGWNDGGKLIQIGSSSCSTVDTAAYILSNTNVTQKKQALAVLESARYCDLNFTIPLYPRAQTTKYCKNQRLNVHKVLTPIANIRNSNLSSASDLHSGVMASKSTKTNDDVYFKAHCDEAVKMESEKQVDVNLSSLEKGSNIGCQAQIIAVTSLSTSTSKFINNAIQHLSINSSSKAQSNCSKAEVLSDDGMFTFPGNCTPNDVVKASHLSFHQAAIQHLNVTNSTTTKEGSSVEAEPISDDEIFPSPSKCKSSNAKNESCWSLDNTVTEHLNTNNNSHSKADSMVREKILTDDEISQSLTSRSSDSLKSPRYKKLYTGRESPVDLEEPEQLSLSRISQGEKSLHPALDPNIGNAVSHRRLKRKKKQRFSCSDANSEFNSDDCIVDSMDDSTQLFGKDSTDSARSASTQNEFQTHLKSITDNPSIHGMLSKEQTPTATDANACLTTTQSLANHLPSVTSESDNFSTLEANGTDQRREPDDINDDPSSAIGAEQAQENDATHHTPHIVETMKDRTEAEGKSINDSLTRVSLCRKKAELSNNSCSKSFLCEVQNLDTDTVDSDQSTILLCECKLGTSLACSIDNLSFTDCSSCEDSTFLDKEAPVVAHNNVQIQNLSPIVLLKRLDKDTLDKKLVASQDVSFDVTELPLNNDSSLNRYAHNKININKRRKLEPVVLLTRLDNQNGSSVKHNQLSPQRSLNKNCVRSSNSNVNKLFVDFSGSTPDKNQDKSDVDRKKNAEPIVVLEKLRFEDHPHLKDNQLSCKRSVTRKRAVLDVKQITNSPISSTDSITKESRISTISSEQSANDVENRIRTPLRYSRLRNLRRTESKLLSLLSSDQEDSSPKTQREEVRATDKVLIVHKNGLNCTTRRKSVRPSYSVKRTSGHSRRRLVRRRTMEHGKVVMMNSRRPILRLSVSHPDNSSPSSASSYSVPPVERTPFTPAPHSNKYLPSRNQAESSSASGSRIMRSRLARSIYFQTKLNPDSDSEISTPSSNGRPVADTGGDARKFRTPLRLSKFIADNSSNISESTLQGHSVRVRRSGTAHNDLKLLDTSDEEDLRLGLTETKRRTRNRTKSFTDTTESPTKRRVLQRRRVTVNNNTQTVFLDNTERESRNVVTQKSGTLRKNLRHMRENVAKPIANESSREIGAYPRKSLLFKTRSHASSLDGSS